MHWLTGTCYFVTFNLTSSADCCIGQQIFITLNRLLVILADFRLWSVSLNILHMVYITIFFLGHELSLYFDCAQLNVHLCHFVIISRVKSLLNCKIITLIEVKWYFPVENVWVCWTLCNLNKKPLNRHTVCYVWSGNIKQNRVLCMCCLWVL